MIKTVADLLEALRAREVEVLDREKIKHGPMIGKMYEGLTRSLLNQSVFGGLDLRVCQGIIKSRNGKFSAQMDCMLVVGEGRRLPYSDDYEYDVDQVIAIVEVKKTLYSGDLTDAYENLCSVVGQVDLNSPAGLELDSAWRTIMKRELPFEEHADKMTDIEYAVLHALIPECLLPVRIALGHHGFRSEYALRKAFFDMIPEDRSTGFLPQLLPNLVIAGQNALVKLNAMPFGAPLVRNEAWKLYGSISGKSMQLLLEVIWTRLASRFRITPSIFGEDLFLEAINPLILAVPRRHGNIVVWTYLDYPMTKRELAARPKEIPWAPVELTPAQFSVLAVLFKDGWIRVDSELEFRRYLEEWSLDLEDFLSDFARTGLVWLDCSGSERLLRILTARGRGAILPDGRLVAGEDDTGRFSRWYDRYMEQHHRRPT